MPRSDMARRFLYIIAFLIVLVLAALLALRLWWDKAAEIALVPTTEFVEQEALETNAYENPAMWFSRPDMDAERDPSRWVPPPPEPAETEATDGAETADSGELPEETAEVAEATEEPAAPSFAVFFIHPTSYFNRASWNAPLDDSQSQGRARIYLRGMASAFNHGGEIWAPRYRQATFGAFITDAPEAARALDAAYRDIDQAFDVFLANIGPDMPIVLAGHSQGGLHVARLLKDRIAGTELQARIAMAYPVGWPMSVEHDLPALGLPACEAPDEGGCIATWTSFAEPAEPGRFLDIYGQSLGFTGTARGDSAVLCVNPINGLIGGDAPAEDNLGTLIPNDDLASGEIVPGAVPARCDEHGLLLIGDPPDLGPYVLPGNNYHVYDIPLFWANLREDVTRRVAAWAAAR